MGKYSIYKFTIDESRILFTTSNKTSISSVYIREIMGYFTIIKLKLVKDLKNASGVERRKKKIRQRDNKKALNRYFYSTTIGYNTTDIKAMRKNKVSYLGSSFGKKIVVSKYYHDNVDKNCLKLFDYEKPIIAMNIGWYRKIMYMYEKKNSTISFVNESYFLYDKSNVIETY